MPVQKNAEKLDLVISVQDTGIGIPESIVSKLLDSNDHYSTNGTKGEKGSGLGLNICNEIVQTNKGWMRIESEPGIGTTILIGISVAEKID